MLRPPAPRRTCAACPRKLNANNATGFCSTCRKDRTCVICKDVVGVRIGRVCLPCRRVLDNIEHVQQYQKGMQRPPAEQLEARLALYEARAARRLPLFDESDRTEWGIAG